MNVEVRGIGGQAGGEFGKLFLRESSFGVIFGTVKTSEIAVPVLGQLTQEGLVLEGAGLFLGSFEFGSDGVGAGLGVGCASVFGVDLPERRMLLDFFVEQGLSDRGVVDLAVAVTTIADQIDDNVSAELVAEFCGDASYADYGVDILGIDVENR